MPCYYLTRYGRWEELSPLRSPRECYRLLVILYRIAGARAVAGFRPPILEEK